MTVLFLAAAAALGALVGGNGSRVLVYALFLLFPLYGGLFEGYNGGQTPGKAALGIRVVSDQGGDCSPGQAFLRNLPAVFVPGTLVYIVALASMAASDRRQRVFDHLASTVVVRA